jgi:hypothetical protein
MISKLQPLVEQMQRERPQLFATVRAVTDEQADLKRPGENYSVREILAHLAGAERGMTRMAQNAAADKNPRLPEGYVNDEYNARQQAKRKDKSVSELVAELTESRQQLFAFMETLRDEDLDKPAEHPIVGDTDVWGVLNVLVEHEQEHTLQLGEWVAELQKEQA